MVIIGDSRVRAQLGELLGRLYVGCDLRMCSDAVTGLAYTFLMRPDLVITDRRPRVDVVRELRSRGSDVAVIVLSPDRQGEEEALAAGATEFICSADDPGVLAAHIRAVTEFLGVHAGARSRGSPRSVGGGGESSRDLIFPTLS